ncbi:response regulator [Chryseolinea sp. T2]|uniref:response regulator n=1 Tax=Chryseolinea sp. T2 TaxID=3129255 RepID=UPI0030781AE4
MRLILVDDDMEEEELFRDAVQTIDPSIEVIWYDDVMNALDALLKDAAQPDLLFLDLNIPKVSGKELLKLLRQYDATSRLPVVIYSTSISKKDVEDTTPYHIKAYLQKPEEFRLLCEKLAELVRNSH